MISPVPSIPIIEGWRCISPDCTYAAPQAESVQKHRRTAHSGEGDMASCLVQKVFHSPVQFLAVDDLYEVLNLSDAARKATLDAFMASRCDDAYQKIIQKPKDERNIPQYLKDWEWIDRIDGCSTKTLLDLVSIPDSNEFGGVLREAVMQYFDENKGILKGMTELIRRMLNTDEG
jgi:hypothetical protein